MRLLRKFLREPEVLLVWIPCRERAAFRMVVLRGMRTCEAAEVLCVDIRTVQRWVRDATDRLKILIRHRLGDLLQ